MEVEYLGKIKKGIFIGDPHYFYANKERKDLFVNKKLQGEYSVYMVSETKKAEEKYELNGIEKTYKYTSSTFAIFIVKTELAERFKKTFSLTTHNIMQGSKKKSTLIGCDTACITISTYNCPGEELHTGADGYVGEVMEFSATGHGMYLMTFSGEFDADYVSLKDIKDCLIANGVV